MAADVTPWWKALKIRQEILNASGQIDDVQMSLFQAVYGTGSHSAAIRRRDLLRRNHPPHRTAG